MIITIAKLKFFDYITGRNVFIQPAQLAGLDLDPSRLQVPALNGTSPPRCDILERRDIFGRKVHMKTFAPKDENNRNKQQIIVPTNCPWVSEDASRRLNHGGFLKLSVM